MKTKRAAVLAVMAAMSLAVTGCAKKDEQKAEAPKAETAQQQPVAGAIPLGVTVAEMAIVIKGWSVKNDILGKEVYNDANEKIGKVEDIIVTPEKAVSYAIIGAGGFLGIDRNDVAIPAHQFKMEGGKIVLPGATKDALKAMPPFTYGK